MNSKKVVVIGAGIGGLASACIMARQGYEVTVLEKNTSAGGKLDQIEMGSFRFDTGPSLLTMPWVLDKLFEYCGAKTNDYLEILPLEELCRYVYVDGTHFRSWQDLEKTLEEVRRIAPDDIENYRNFLEYSRRLYNTIAPSFILHPLRKWRDLLKLPLGDVFGIDAFTTVSKRVDSRIKSPYLRQFFKRFVTYNGSNPYQAPATLNVIPHVELNEGGYCVKGGMYQIVAALLKLGGSLGVKFMYEQDVEEIRVRNKMAYGVKTKNDDFGADIVISNSDANETYLKLLDPAVISGRTRRRIHKNEPSCSAFVILLGTNKTWDKLAHHTIFFSEDYKKEFKDIFNEGMLPDDPTIYVANTSYTDKEHAIKGGSNLFILINAPCIREKPGDDDPDYADYVINVLEKRGLSGLRSSIVEQKIITPLEFYKKYRSNRGSIYGTSSNSKLSAFMRPRNRSRSVRNLWLTGGSTHPGGGIPLCIISAFHACGVEIKP